MDIIQELKKFILSKKFWINVGLITLVNILVAIFLMFYLNNKTNNGQKIAVPHLKGKHVSQVAGLLKDSGLEYEVLDSLYYPELPEGTVVYQDPECTDSTSIFIKEARVIRIRVSKKSRLIEMPDLNHKSERFAESILKNRGIKYQVSYESTTESDGAVLRQSYKGKIIVPGTRIPVGATIQITVGKNMGGEPFQVPNLEGLTINEVNERLSFLSNPTVFAVYNNCTTREDSLSALVISQTPEFIQGNMTPAHSTITVVLQK